MGTVQSMGEVDERDRVWLTSTLQEHGWSRTAILRAADAGYLTRVRRGAYARPIEGEPADSQHRRRAVAAALQTKSVAISHISAIVMHELPLWQVRVTAVHLMRTGSARAVPGNEVSIHAHVAGVGTTPVGLVPVVNVPDALVQFALTLEPFEDPVPWRIAGDAALASGAINATDLDAALARHARRTGIGRARALAPLLDAGHESPGETRLAVALELLGYRSTPQVTIRSGGHAYRVDRLLDVAPVVVEFDGALKYRQATIEESHRALLAEKQREDALRSVGLEFVRVDWSMVGDLPALRAAIEAALARHHRR